MIDLWSEGWVKAKEEIVRWMGSRGYATGRGDTIFDLLYEIEGQAKERALRELWRGNAGARYPHYWGDGGIW